jgi:hypothetical protein
LEFVEVVEVAALRCVPLVCGLKPEFSKPKLRIEIGGRMVEAREIRFLFYFLLLSLRRYFIRLAFPTTSAGFR